jgi:hypothetical protein
MVAGVTEVPSRPVPAPTVLVVIRLRDPEAAGGSADAPLRSGLEHAREVLAAKPGYAGGEVGRNVDDPGLWVLSTRWRDIGSYRRALGSWEGKMHIQPLMVHALDEPSAYELDGPGADLNVRSSRRRPEEGDDGARPDGSLG